MRLTRRSGALIAGGMTAATVLSSGGRGEGPQAGGQAAEARTVVPVDVG